MRAAVAVLLVIAALAAWGSMADGAVPKGATCGQASFALDASLQYDTAILADRTTCEAARTLASDWYAELIAAPPDSVSFGVVGQFGPASELDSFSCRFRTDTSALSTVRCARGKRLVVWSQELAKRHAPGERRAVPYPALTEVLHAAEARRSIRSALAGALGDQFRHGRGYAPRCTRRTTLVVACSFSWSTGDVDFSGTARDQKVEKGVAWYLQGTVSGTVTGTDERCRRLLHRADCVTRYPLP